MERPQHFEGAQLAAFQAARGFLSTEAHTLPGDKVRQRVEEVNGLARDALVSGELFGGRSYLERINDHYSFGLAAVFSLPDSPVRTQEMPVLQEAVFNTHTQVADSTDQIGIFPREYTKKSSKR